MSNSIRCQKCGAEYDKLLQSCPSCGVAATKTRNKGFIVILTAVILLIIIAIGCSVYFYLENQKTLDSVTALDIEDLIQEKEKKELALLDAKVAEQIKNEREQLLNKLESEYEKRKHEFEGELVTGNSESGSYSCKEQVNENGYDALSQHDLDVIDQLERIDNEVELSKQKMQTAYYNYRMAIVQYGKTLPAFSYRKPVYDAIYETRDLCREAIRYAKTLKIIDNRQIIEMNQRQIDGCNQMINAINSEQ